MPSDVQQTWPWIRSAGVNSGRIVRFSLGPEPESKFCEKLAPDMESRFNFGSSRRLRGHLLCKTGIR